MIALHIIVNIKLIHGKKVSCSSKCVS